MLSIYISFLRNKLNVSNYAVQEISWEDCLSSRWKPLLKRCFMSCLRPINLGTQFVPCGTCLGCLEDRQKVWYFRNMFEWHFNSVQAYFVTLTYDDVHLPMHDISEDGDYKWIPVIQHKDVYKFIRRLKYHIPRFRYFGISEYSPSPMLRPHFHIIIYLKSPVPLEFMVDSVVKAWSEPYSSVKDNVIIYGRPQVEELTSGRISYVTTYLLTKQYGEDKLYPLSAFPKNFQSNRPGIGDRCDNKQLRNYFDTFPFSTCMYFPDGSPMATPRYYRERLVRPTSRRFGHVLRKIQHFEMIEPDQDYLDMCSREKYRKYYLKSLKRICDE